MLESPRPRSIDSRLSDPPTGRLDAARLVESLSPAQRAVLPRLLEGKTDVQIARQIFRSRHTVRDHARAIFAACGVRNRADLILWFAALREARTGP